MSVYSGRTSDGKTLVAYGELFIGMKLRPSAILHAVSLVFEMESHSKTAMKYYRVTDEGLEMRGWISDDETAGYQQLPYGCDAQQTAEFVMHWLRSMIDDKGNIVDRAAFQRFAGEFGVGGDGGDYPDSFMLAAESSDGFTVRPAWMYYPK